MQIIRTLGQLSDGDRELALDFIIGIVLLIKVTSCGHKAHQCVIFIGIESCLQIEAVFPVFLSLSEDGRIKSILLLDGGIL